jgi:hypothetical protein
VRKLASIVVSAGVLVSLSACAAGPSTFADCGPSGNAALVTAEGSFGKDPAAEFPTPLVSTKAETAEIRPGDGKDVPEGGVVYGTVSVYDGKTGDALGGDTPLVGIQLLASTRDFVYPFADALACAEVGSRIVTTGTNQQLFGESGIGGDIAPDDTLVVVTDVTDAFLGRANGADQIAQDGMPAIVLAPNGQPGFTFPDTELTEFRADLLKRGSGPVVEDGDNVVIHYTSVVWGATSVTESTWSGSTASPTIVPLDGTDVSGTSITGAVKDAIVGTPVGSQLLIVAPGDSTLVYVIDVLGIAE